MDPLNTGVVIGVGSSFLFFCMFIGIRHMCKSCQNAELKQSRSEVDLTRLHVETY
jgi:hypothetical protein